ncbi:MAG: phycobilisome rod-core linker polypeptide [Prochlorococcus sp.]
MKTIPLLHHQLSVQNSRVNNFIADNQQNEFPAIGSANHEMNAQVSVVIEKAYRQIFFHVMSCDRDPYLESQLFNGSITIKDFIRGLLLSRRFQEGYLQCNSNYRIVDQLVGRILGRSVHGDGERHAWSIVIADQGFEVFVDQLLSGDEYMATFGTDRIPRQRSRCLPGRAVGDIPIEQRLPRYAADWRDSLEQRAPAKLFVNTYLSNQPNFWSNLQLASGIDYSQKGAPWTAFLDYQAKVRSMGRELTITEYLHSSKK